MKPGYVLPTAALTFSNLTIVPSNSKTCAKISTDESNHQELSEASCRMSDLHMPTRQLVCITLRGGQLTSSQMQDCFSLPQGLCACVGGFGSEQKRTTELATTAMGPLHMHWWDYRLERTRTTELAAPAMGSTVL